MAEPRSRPRGSARWWRWLPVLPVVAGALVFAAAALRDQGDTEPALQHITSDAPVFASLGELVSASDVIVVADVVDVSPGRSIGPRDDAGTVLVTELVEIEVLETLRGPETDHVTLEEVASLGDGTPVVLDGQPASQVGERLLLFLLAGDGTDAAPYATVVNGQGRYELGGDPVGVVGPASVLPVDWTLDELRRLAAACTAQPAAC